MGNSRAFRRRLKAPAAVPGPDHPRRQPWNKGRALTSRPSYSTVGRWLREGVAEGLVERRVKRGGSRGRPPFEYRMTEEGRRRHRAMAVPPAVAKMREDQLRRWDNAKRLRAQARADRLAKEAARQGRVLAMRRRALTDEEHNVLLARMILDASKALIAADFDASALNAEEARVLTENGLAVPEGGKLVLAGDWLEEFREILHGGARFTPAEGRAGDA